MCDSAIDFKRKQGENAYRLVVQFLLANQFPGAAEELLIRWWNEVGARQLTEPTPIKRALTAFTLCQLYLAQKDFGGAPRWDLLTHADDRLHEHREGGGAGMQYLRTILGAIEALGSPAIRQGKAVSSTTGLRSLMSQAFDQTRRRD